MKTISETVLELEPLPLRPNTARPHTSAAGQNPAAHAALPGMVVGKLVGFDGVRMPLVDFPGNKSGLARPARSLVALMEQAAGSEVALLFEMGDLGKPIILGLLQSPQAEAGNTTVNVGLDGEEVTLAAKNEIVLRCGKASITLTRAGKIIIRGAYVLSRSSGVNRIKGGSVQIN